MSSVVDKKILIAIGLLTLLVGVFALSSCSQPEEPQELQEAADAEEEPQEDILVIGKETVNAIQVEATNTTGKEIVDIAIKDSSQEEYPDSLMNADQVIGDEQKVLIYFEPEATEEKKEEEGRAADLILRDLFSVQITFDDESLVELHDLNFEEISDIKFCLSEEGVGYLEYLTSEGEKENTLEFEKGLLAEQEAAAKAAEEARAAEEAQAAEEQYDYSYDYGTYDDSSEGSSGSQDEDQCVDDLVLR